MFIFTPAESVQMTNTGNYITKTFRLDDISFRSRMINNSDMRIYAQNGNLTLRSVRVRKRHDQVKAFIGESNVYKGLFHLRSDNPNEPNYNPIAVMGGELCRRTVAGKDKYLFFRVARGFIEPGHRWLQLNITFWGERFSDGDRYLRLNYNRMPTNAHPWNTAYHPPVDIEKSGNPEWQTAEILINDADFRGALWFYADFRISNLLEEFPAYVKSVEVIRLDPF